MKTSKVIWLISVLSFVFSLIPGQAIALDERVIDVAQITWTGAKSTEVSLQDIANSIDSKVSENWRNFTTLIGASQDRTINFKLGKLLEEPVKLMSPMSCEGDDFSRFKNSLRAEVYSRLGIVEWSTRYLVILAPPSGCIWSGRAAIGDFSSKGGFIVLHNTASAFVITHELGHSLGLGHSNLLRCESQAKDGPWGSNCKAVEYGGSIDVMGNVETNSSLSTYHQWRMGLLASIEIRQSWTNETVELIASDIKGGTRAVFIRDGDATYWIEYRRPGPNNFYKPGIVVYRTDPPPLSVINSPNPDDRLGNEPGLGVGTDYWMLNLDSYNYSPTGRATGSMTLPSSSSFTLFSGNVTIQAMPTEVTEEVLLKISRKADTTPPPVPILSSQDTWISPDSQIVKDGYEDRESLVANFELKIDGVIQPSLISEKADFVPTYLDPFVARRSIFVKNLPEGNYNLSVRSIDVWGNASAWSSAQTVNIDRSFPNVGEAITVNSLEGSAIVATLQDFNDLGGGLCRTALFNNSGFVTQLQNVKSSPKFKFELGKTWQSNFEAFDCLGNGVTGKLNVENSYKPAQEFRRNGKWSPVKIGDRSGLRCLGKCTISLTAKDSISIISGEGSAIVSISGKELAKIPDSRNQSLRVGSSFSVGSKPRILRISGSNFVVFGLVQSRIQLSSIKEVKKFIQSPDESLTDSAQQRLSMYGFQNGDLSNGWSVLPMNRGTTLLDPTLDLCGGAYKSEAGRQYRRQTIAINPSSPYAFLSSEVVRYKDKNSAMLALTELKSYYLECLKNNGGIESDGKFVDYSFYTVQDAQTGLVDEKYRVLVRAQIGKKEAARQLFAIYQFRDEMFTGLYVVKDGEIRFSDEEILEWLDAGTSFAKRLERKF